MTSCSVTAAATTPCRPTRTDPARDRNGRVTDQAALLSDQCAAPAARMPCSPASQRRHRNVAAVGPAAESDDRPFSTGGIQPKLDLFSIFIPADLLMSGDPRITSTGRLPPQTQISPALEQSSSSAMMQQRGSRSL